MKESAYGTDGDDVLELPNGSGDVHGSAGDDDIRVTVWPNQGNNQIHVYSGTGDDLTIIDHVLHDRNSFGVHWRGGEQFGKINGSDVVNFVNVDDIDAVSVGRLEDFDPSRDSIRFEGQTIDLDDLPPT